MHFQLRLCILSLRNHFHLNKKLLRNLRTSHTHQPKDNPNMINGKKDVKSYFSPKNITYNNKILV